MSLWKKTLLLQVWFLLVLPLLGWGLVRIFGPVGAFIPTVLFVVWVWEVFAYLHYRHCRQEEFLHVLQTAAATHAPIESVFRAYLSDRPREFLYRFILLFFVFPGYFWIHMQRSFDRRVSRLVAMLDSGMPLDHAIRLVPGVVTKEIALAVSVGSYSGKLTNALQRLPDRRLGPQWLELAPRVLYPILIIVSMLNVVAYVLVEYLPRFERIAFAFKFDLPPSTEFLISFARWLGGREWLVVFAWVLLLIFINLLLFSSRARWYFPVVSWVYRLYARGQFLRMLGLMLETGKPLPQVLEHALETRLLPGALQVRVTRLASDIDYGVALTDSLDKHGLITGSMRSLIMSAQAANNLPWALQELGDSLMRRSSRVLHWLTMVSFPLVILTLACLIGFGAYSIYAPLVTMMEKMHG
jgi:type IV pilus assembly protein PilC